MADRIASLKAMVCSPRIVGVASAGFPLASIFNRTGSGVLVAVRRLSLQNDYTTNTGTMRVLAVSRITTAPASGTLHTPVAMDTSGTHEPLVEFRSSASADGVASTITATPGPKGWQQYPIRLADLVTTGQVAIVDASIVPDLLDEDPLILAEGEGLLIAAVDAPSTSQHFIVNAVFEEFLYAAGGTPHSETIDDTAGVADSVTPVTVTERTIPDTAGVADTVAKAITLEIADTADVDDAAATEQGREVELDDSVGVSDDTATIELVGVTYDGIAGPNGTVSPAKHANWQEGLYEVALVAVRSNTLPSNTAVATPTGWALLSVQARAAGSKAWVFARRAQAGDADPSFVASGVAGNGPLQAMRMAWRGVNVASPVDVITSVNGSTPTNSHQAPSATTTVPNTTLLRMLYSALGGTAAQHNWNVAATEIGDYDVLDSAGTAVGSISAAVEQFAGPGATGTRQAFYTGSGAYTGFTAAMAPQPAFTIETGKGETIDDTAGVADNVAPETTGAILRTIDDTATVADATSYDVAKPIDDSVSISDAHAKAVAHPVDDSLTVADALVLSAHKAIADTAGVADALQTAANALLAIGDTAGAADALTTLATWQRAIDDTAGALDSLSSTSAYSRTVPDTLSVADTLTPIAVWARIVADTLGVADNVNASGAGALTKAIDDTLSVADNVSRLLVALRQVDDSLAVNDSVTRLAAHGRPIDDAVGADDALASAAAYARILEDLASVADELVPFVPRPGPPGHIDPTAPGHLEPTGAGHIDRTGPGHIDATGPGHIDVTPPGHT